MATAASARKSSPRKAPTKKAAPRRATTPRKRAAARADGAAPSEDSAVPSSTNGHAPEAPNAKVSFVAYDDPYAEELPRFTYWPKDEAVMMVGSDPIIVPSFVTIMPTKHFLWKTRKDPMQQDNMWLDLAGIPNRIQERIVLLPDAAYKEFWRLWVQQEIPNPTDMPDAQVAGAQVPVGAPGESSP